MIEYILPFLAGVCIGACAIYVVCSRVGIPASIIRQTILILTTLYGYLENDGKIDEVERKALAIAVGDLIGKIKTEYGK